MLDQNGNQINTVTNFHPKSHGSPVIWSKKNYLHSAHQPFRLIVPKKTDGIFCLSNSFKTIKMKIFSLFVKKFSHLILIRKFFDIFEIQFRFHLRLLDHEEW